MPTILSLPDRDTAVSTGFCFLAGAGWFIHKKLVSGRQFDTVDDLARWLEGHFDEGAALLQDQTVDYLTYVVEIGKKSPRVISQGMVYCFSAVALPHVKIGECGIAQGVIRDVICLIERQLRRGVPDIGKTLANAIEGLPEALIVHLIAPVELPGTPPQAPPDPQGVPAPPQQEGLRVNQGVPRAPTVPASPPSPHRGRLLPMSPPRTHFSPIVTRTRGALKRKEEEAEQLNFAALQVKGERD